MTADHPLVPCFLPCVLSSPSSLSSLPAPQVLEVEDVIQDEASRRRMRVLAHLPLTATFKLCEVDLSGE